MYTEIIADFGDSNNMIDYIQLAAKFKDEFIYLLL